MTTLLQAVRALCVTFTILVSFLWDKCTVCLKAPHSKIQNPKSHKGEMRNADIEKPYMPN